VVAPDVAAEALAAVPVAVAPDAADLAALVVAAVPVFVVAAVVVVADRVVARLLFFVGLRRGLRHNIACVERRGVDRTHQNCRQYRPGQETFFCVQHQDFHCGIKSRNTKSTTALNDI
jgi:hypothetical protein